MRCFAVTGVKGGVGKSTFSILLSKKFVDQNKKVVLVDLDVEAPNDHILLKARIKKVGSVYTEKPKLIKRKCKKCGTCAKVCKEHAIFWVEGQYPIFFPELCNGCGVCWKLCPFGAIKPVKVRIGDYYLSKIEKNFWLITGKSKEGISETSQIVKETKEFAEKFGRKIGADFLIIDTAPGIRCNVIHALMNCDKAFAVTEPTPLGEHDLSLCLELLKKLKIKSSVVLNKSNIGDKKGIEKIAEKFGTKIEYEIPYSESLLKAYFERRLAKWEMSK